MVRSVRCLIVVFSESCIVGNEGNACFAFLWFVARCLGKAMLRDYGISWVFSLLVHCPSWIVAVPLDVIGRRCVL